MPAKDKIRVAVVGLGFGAEFVPIYLDHPDVASVAICDSNPARLDKAVDKIRKKYGSTAIKTGDDIFSEGN